MSKSVSIIIPTYNRLRILKQTLYALAQQTVRPNRVIIIDDGSPRQDIKALKQFVDQMNLPIWFMENAPQKGPAAARNKGIFRAKEDLVLFLNDDTVPSGKTFLETHLALANQFPDCSIMGPFGGHQQSAGNLLYGKWVEKLGIEVTHPAKAGQILSFQHFCTANICVPRKFLTNCLFDENFPYPAHEDTDFGYRLHLKGILLRYNPYSPVRHLHDYTPEMIVNRQKNIGECASYLLQKHPELGCIFKPKLPRFLCRPVKWLMETPLSLFLTDDFRLFLLGLVAKYNSFYDCRAKNMRLFK